MKSETKYCLILMSRCQQATECPWWLGHLQVRRKSQQLHLKHSVCPQFLKCGQTPSSHLALLSDVLCATSVTTWMALLSEEPSADSEGWTLFLKITLVKGSDFS